MPTHKHLDYIQASITLSEHDVIDKKLPRVPALAYYKRGYKDENGTRYYFGNPNSKKALCVLSGGALDELRGVGHSDGQILQGLLNLDASFTRLDSAITVYGEDDIFHLGEIQNAYRDGLIESPLCARGGTLVSKMELDGEVYPETFYIGDMKKRAKKGLFRAYDKGAMLDITRETLMRIELEERGSNADNSAKRISDGAGVSSVFKSRFNIKTDKFQAIYDAESIEIARGKNKSKEISPEEKRWKWLIEQVAPTLRNALYADGFDVVENENFTKFLAASGLGEKINEVVMARIAKK